MWEWLPPSADRAYDNFWPTQKKEIISSSNYPSNFTVFEQEILDWYFEQAKNDTINDVNAIIWEFNWKEEDLLKYLRQKKSWTLSYDDKIQLSNLELALMKSKSQVNQQTQNNLQRERNQVNEEVELNNTIDFRISWSVKLKTNFSRDEFYLVKWKNMEIEALWNNSYKAKIIVQRRSRSSWQWKDSFDINFYYDGRELILFRDNNRSNQFEQQRDNYLPVDIRYKQGIKKEWNLYRKSYFSTWELSIPDSITNWNTKELKLNFTF